MSRYYIISLCGDLNLSKKFNSDKERLDYAEKNIGWHPGLSRLDIDTIGRPRILPIYPSELDREDK